MTLSLQAWENFYVIVGSSAAALTGLQFVVIALGAETRSIRQEGSVAAFGTPTVVHFCTVLLIAALISTPGHTPHSLGLCTGAIGLAGILYAGWVIRQARRQTGYVPVFEDWLFHAALPLLAYLCLLAAGVLAVRHPGDALYGVAATSLLLLYVGIHNAWDAAVYMSARKGQDSEPAPPKP
ncbi:MAG TPA: hypothetical protein VE007_07455 [Thermoanaerobaculia bacterium]|nr:hypothetical protein [Thermoanaerobaculia bacterium]